MALLCLVAVNSAWYQSNPALYWLRGSLRGLPWRVKIREFNLAEPRADILAALCRENPQAVGFSAYIWNSSYLRELIPELKLLLPQAKLVLGGPEAEACDYGLDSRDYVVSGPGEGVLRRLAESGFRLPGGLYSQPAPPLRELPFPYRGSDLAALSGKLLYYEASRGCPFHCVYCLSASDQRCEARFDPREPAGRRRLHRELDRLLALRPRTLKFVDRSFNSQPELARLIWSYALRSEAACEFHFEIYPDLLNEEDIDLLSRAPAGRIRFEIGIQSVSDAVCRRAGRPTRWRKTRPLLQALLERTPVRVHADLLAGLPGESYRSILRSVDELATLLPHEIQLGLLKILPHTPMQALARSRGYIWQPAPPYQILSTDQLSWSQVNRLQEYARALNLYWNKGEFAPQWREWLAAGRQASALLARLLALHHSQNQPLHSVSRQTRQDFFFRCSS